MTLAAQLAIVHTLPLASHKGEAFFAGGGGDGRGGHGWNLGMVRGQRSKR